MIRKAITLYTSLAASVSIDRSSLDHEVCLDLKNQKPGPMINPDSGAPILDAAGKPIMSQPPEVLFIGFGKDGFHTMLPTELLAQGTTYESEELATFGELVRGMSITVRGFLVKDDLDSSDVESLNLGHENVPYKKRLELVDQGTPVEMIFRARWGTRGQGRVGQLYLVLNQNINVPMTESTTNASNRVINWDLLPGLNNIITGAMKRGPHDPNPEIAATWKILTTPADKGGYMPVQQNTTAGTASGGVDAQDLAAATAAGANALLDAAVQPEEPTPAL